MAIFTIKYKVTDTRILVGEADTLAEIQTLVEAQITDQDWMDKVKTEYVTDKVVEILGTQEITG